MHLFNESWQGAFRIIERLEANGFEAVVVGGAVRDYLLRREVHDVDVATSALPEEVKAIFPRTIDVGIAHGTVLVLSDNVKVEVTTFRTDGIYNDHRRPSDVQFVRSLEQDLLRRDFTMNAVAMRRDGMIIDLYGGKEDIENGLIRAVGHATMRFKEDALRMVRAVRFVAQLGFTIEDATFTAIQQHAQDIQLIARERIKAELDKVWCSANAYKGLQFLEQTGLASYLKGNFYATSWCNFHTEDERVGWALLALLNKYFMQEILSFYRLSNKEKQFIRSVIDAYEQLQSNGWQIMDYFYFDLNVLQTAFYFCQILENDTRGISEQVIQQTKNNLVIQSKQELVVSGLDFIEWSGQKRGPWLKDVLEAVLVAVVTGTCQNERNSIKEWYENEFNKRRHH